MLNKITYSSYVITLAIAINSFVSINAAAFRRLSRFAGTVPIVAARHHPQESRQQTTNPHARLQEERRLFALIEASLQAGIDDLPFGVVTTDFGTRSEEEPAPLKQSDKRD